MCSACRDSQLLPIDRTRLSLTNQRESTEIETHTKTHLAHDMSAKQKSFAQQMQAKSDLRGRLLANLQRCKQELESCTFRLRDEVEEEQALKASQKPRAAENERLVKLLATKAAELTRAEKLVKDVDLNMKTVQAELSAVAR